MITNTYTYAFCPNCNHRLQECSDDEDQENYYECPECGSEWDLDGFERRQGCACGGFPPMQPCGGYCKYPYTDE